MNDIVDIIRDIEDGQRPASDIDPYVVDGKLYVTRAQFSSILRDGDRRSLFNELCGHTPKPERHLEIVVAG